MLAMDAGFSTYVPIPRTDGRRERLTGFRDDRLTVKAPLAVTPCSIVLRINQALNAVNVEPAFTPAAAAECVAARQPRLERSCKPSGSAGAAPTRLRCRAPTG